MPELTEEEVGALVEGMCARNELHFASEDEYREALALLSRSELEDLLALQWQRRRASKQTQ